MTSTTSISRKSRHSTTVKIRVHSLMKPRRRSGDTTLVIVGWKPNISPPPSQTQFLNPSLDSLALHPAIRPATRLALALCVGWSPFEWLQYVKVGLPPLSCSEVQAPLVSPACSTPGKIGLTTKSVP